MSEKRICEGICKRYKVSKPQGIGRYKAGQGRCQICDIWIDYRGAHTKNGEPATDDSKGWYCNCCNYRVRRNPRNVKYKTRLRHSNFHTITENVDLSYFNKRRALLLKALALVIIKQESKDNKDQYSQFLSDAKINDIEFEFGTSIGNLFELANTVEPPNKISMIVEFERVRHVLECTPTKQDIEKHTKLRSTQYEKEFGTWEHFLERLGYDPWYRS